MNTHYNAFISYRHHPEDSAAAQQIHRSLERYKLPKSMEKSGRKIHRLFRDKDELPITSNLSEDIQDALTHSDFLIVICSTHTKESTWVQREIDLFLQSHDRDHVLTVLLNGEPYEVIPPCLLKDTVRDPVTGQEKTVSLEPLSCDWRTRSRKVRAQELDRLAAALLGCRYDDLRQRQKHYQTQKKMAALSVALGIAACFMAYFLYSNHQLQKANDQIRENLSQSLKNQSVHLASESLRLTDSGDRMTAMALALEALPREGNRPYVASAEYALSRAAGIYQADPRLSACAALDVGTTVRDMRLTYDQKTLYILDQRGALSAWDTESHGRLWRLPLEKLDASIEITAEGNLVCSQGIDLFCIQRDGKELWKLENLSGYTILKDFNTLCYVPLSLTGGGTEFHFMNLDTHMETQPVLAADRPGALRLPSVSSGNSVLLQYQDRWNILDCGRREIYPLPLQEEEILAVSSGSGDSILVLSRVPSEQRLGHNGDRTSTSARYHTLSCLQKGSGDLLWSLSIRADLLSPCLTLDPLPGTDQIFLQLGNQLAVIREDDGKILSHVETPGTPLSVRLFSYYAQCVLDNGRLCSFYYGNSTCDAIPMGKNDLVCAAHGDQIYAIDRTGTQVISYETVRDRNAKSSELSLSEMYCPLSSSQALAYFDQGSVHLMDPDTGSEKWSKLCGEMEYYYAPGGMSPEGDQIWVFKSDGVQNGFAVLDAADGTIRSVPLPTEGRNVYYTPAVHSADGHLFLFAADNDSGETYLVSCNMETEELGYAKLWDLEQNHPHMEHLLSGSRDHALILDLSGHSIYEADFRNHSAELILEQVAEAPGAAIFPEGAPFQAAIGLRGSLILKNFGEAPALTIPTGESTVLTCHWAGDQLLALCDDGRLLKFSKTGQLLSAVDFPVSEAFLPGINQPAGPDFNAFSWQQTPDGELLLKAFDSACILDSKTFSPIALIPHFSGYLPQQDLIFTTVFENFVNRPWSVKRYDREALTDYALTDLQDFTLSPRQKQIYGLNSD